MYCVNCALCNIPYFLWMLNYTRFFTLKFSHNIFWGSRGKSAVVNVVVEREFGIPVSVAKRHVHCRGQVAMKVEGCKFI